jgi:hypothetical protein
MLAEVSRCKYLVYKSVELSPLNHTQNLVVNYSIPNNLRKM